MYINEITLASHITKIQRALELDLLYRNQRCFNGTLIDALLEFGLFLRNTFSGKKISEVPSILESYSPLFSNLEFPSLTSFAETSIAVSAYQTQDDVSQNPSADTLTDNIQLGLHSYAVLLGKQRVQENTNSDEVDSRRIETSKEYLAILIEKRKATEKKAAERQKQPRMTEEEKIKLLMDCCQQCVVSLKKKILQFASQLPADVLAVYQVNSQVNFDKTLSAAQTGYSLLWGTTRIGPDQLPSFNPELLEKNRFSAHSTQTHPELHQAITQYLTVLDLIQELSRSDQSSANKLTTVKHIMKTITPVVNMDPRPTSTPSTDSRAQALIARLSRWASRYRHPPADEVFYATVKRILKAPLPQEIAPPTFLPTSLPPRQQTELAMLLGHTIHTIELAQKTCAALQTQLQQLAVAVNVKRKPPINECVTRLQS